MPSRPAVTRLGAVVLVLAGLLIACTSSPKAAAPPPPPAQTALPPQQPATLSITAAAGPSPVADVTRTKGPWLPDDPQPTMKSYSHPVPTHKVQYTMDIAVDTLTYTLTGRQTMRITNNESTQLPALVFHLYPNAPYHTQEMDGSPRIRPGELTVDVLTANGQQVVGTLSPDKEILEVGLPTPLAPGQSVELAMNWRSVIPSVPDRLGVIGPAIFMAHAFPILAVHDEAGWHVDRFMDTGDPLYSEVADFDATFTVPNGWLVAATGHAGQPQASESSTKSHFTAPNVRDFAAVTSARWHVYEAEVDGIHVRYFRDLDDTKTRYQGTAPRSAPADVLRYATGALHFFGQRFGAYPYQDFTIVDHNGMEYPQLIMAEARPSVIVHEIAHQWWYGIVGNDEVRQIWDEGLTQFSNVWYQASIGEFRGFGYGMSATEALNKTLYTYHSHAYAQGTEQRSYGNTIYGRGTLMWEELRETMGTPAFEQMLRDFVQAHKFGIATWDDVRQTITQHAGDKGAAIFEKYVQSEEYPEHVPTGIPLP